MDDLSAAEVVPSPSSDTFPEVVEKRVETVSTHVLVPEEQAARLRELSRRTRVAQSEYLREAVDDVLEKSGRKPEGAK